MPAERHPYPAAVPPATHAAGALHRASWGGIFAGTVIALALMVLFSTLGVAIGAGVIDPLSADGQGGGGAVGWSGAYLVLTQLLSLAAGGYVAAKLAGTLSTLASALHGATVWALATLILAWAAVSGAGMAAGAAGSALAATARTAGSAVEAVVPDDVSLPDLSGAASQLSVEDLPPELQQSLEEAGVTVPQIRAAAQEALRSVVTEEEQQQAREILASAATDALRSPGDAPAILEEAFGNLIGGPDAVLSEEDEQQILNVLQRRLGIAPQEAEQIAAAIGTEVEGAVDTARQTLEDARQQALQAADAAADAVSTAAWWLTLASLLGLAAAAGAAAAGRRHPLPGEAVL